MQFGLCLPNFPFGVQPTPDALVGVAQAAEQGGFHSVWATDHILVPNDKPRYGLIYEALTTLAYLGARTERVRLGTSILVIGLRDAILAAKQTATIDALTGGRMILGLGAGYMQGEFENLGRDFHRRGEHFDEAIRVMRALWTEDSPAFDGQSYHFQDTLFGPKPVGSGGIPIYVGGNSDRALRRAAALGDSTHFDDFTAEQVRAAGDKLRRLTEANGRHVALSVRRTVDLRPALALSQGQTPPTAGAGALAGSIEEVRAALAAYADAGLDHFICQFEHDTQAEHLAQIALFARAIIAEG
ncbi:MAG: TIGR03619 family F420-dependent LLM class oxidoreductase [Anaerolineae bacterium]